MRFRCALLHAAMALWSSSLLAYVPGKTPSGANRHWISGTISFQLTGPAMVDGHAVHDGVRDAIVSWNAIAHAQIRLTASGVAAGREPSIGNGRNEFGWVESSDNPYFVPGVPCTTAYIYDTLSGVMQEADTTCNAMDYQWPDDMFGLFAQDNVVDAESAALTAFGTWLGLDASLQYGDPMSPVTGSGSVRRLLSGDEFSFGRHQYGDGTSAYGSIAGHVQLPDHSPAAYAYVAAIGVGGGLVYGAVADTSGAYSVSEVMAGSYSVLARPLTTDPYILSSAPYRANAILNLDFTPQYYGAGAQVQVQDGMTTSGIDIAASRGGSQADAYEPNDSAASASSLIVGSSRLASTSTAFDKDWYSFQTTPNTCYVIATALHGASIVPTLTSETFWSRTRVSIYDGPTLVGENESRDEFQLDPGNWITYCESGSGRRLDLEIEQRAAVGGAGYFYAVFAQPISDGPTLAPRVAGLYPSSGWSNRNRFVWIDGAGFMPGAKVDIRLPNATWVGASDVITARCDSSYHCDALKALLPPGTPGLADVKVTNPNGRSDTKTGGFTYLAPADGPVDDRTPQAFGVRYGQGKAVCVGDYDGDGSDDILKTRGASLPYQLFRNNGNGTFSDVAGSAGLHLSSSTWGRSCSWVDVDDDGDLDAYVSNVAYSLPSGSVNELYVNRLADDGNASFTLDTPSGLGGASSRYKSDAAWADYDDDGRLDVVLAYDSYAGSPPYFEAVQFFRQNVNGSFSDVTASSGLGGYFASIISVLAADFDNDRCEDLAFFTYGGGANRLYKGDCRGHFTDVTVASRIADGSPWCTGVAVADFNNDGNADIFCGTYNTGAGPIRPRLWLNNGHGAFVDRASEAGLFAIARNMDVILPLDEDNDGLMDVYVGSSERGWPDDRKDALLRNLGGNPPAFSDITDAAGMYPTTQDGSGQCVENVDEFYCDRDASAGGVFDWYNDGALDVFVTGDDPDYLQRGSDFLWRNGRNVITDGTLAPSNDWIEVALKGANTPQSRVLSNRFGIGARVTVIPRLNLPGGEAPTETQCLQNPLPSGVTVWVKEVLAGNRSQSPTTLHFGLGNVLPFGRKRVDCVKVSWPSGLERAYTAITANTRVVLAEDVGRMKIISVVPNSGVNTRSDPTTVLGLRFDRDVWAVPEVFFGAVPALSVTFVSEHELRVLPPLWQQPGPVDVTVVNTDGERDTLIAAYTFTGASNSLRFKDPVPDLISVNGVIPNDPAFIATRGIERTGVIADGVTELVLEAEVAGPGSVRFALDDNDDPGDAPPPTASVGSTTPLGGGTTQTSATAPVTHLADGRYVAHALYVAPQNFVRNDTDKYFGKRNIWVRVTFIDSANGEHPIPARSLDLVRVPVLYVHGIWGNGSTFHWQVAADTRWITHRADYGDTNDVDFGQNANMPPRVIAELRKQINDMGIAGTRFFVFAYSMGAMLFKIYMSHSGAPYARADNFFAGDVYALVPVDAPFYGAYFATFVRQVRSLPLLGSKFEDLMSSLDMAVDHGCIESLDAEGSDTLGIPTTLGTFHAIVGWGGGEMRAAGVALADKSRLASLKSVLELLNFDFENFILRCTSGDDFIVCADSQAGGLTGSRVSDFHFAGPSAKAIHFDSICDELSPSAVAEQLLNTPTTDVSVWGQVLPQAPPLPLRALPTPAPVLRSDAPKLTESDGIVLTLGKEGDGVTLGWVGAATRLLKAFGPGLVGGVCLEVSGSSTSDAHALTLPADTYYALGPDSLCSPQDSLSLAAVSPPDGSAMGGYPITLLGAGFSADSKVKVGNFFARQVMLVNSTTLTCLMPPGNPGSSTIMVINPSGQTATATFRFTNPGEVPGALQITAPVTGTVFAAGSTITVSATGTGGFKIARALVSGPGFVSDADENVGDGFSTHITLPPESMGPITIQVLARDANGNLMTADPVTITAIVPGNVSLLRIDAERVTMLYATPTRQLHVFGIYSDGIRREITHAPGVTFEMDTQDIRKPNYPYNGTGVAVVDASGLVIAKTKGTTLCHIAYAGIAVDVVVEVAEIRPNVTLQKPGFISWPYQGPGVTYDVIRGRLSALRATSGNFSDPSIGMVCIKNDFTNVTAADGSNPSLAEGFFYLMRESRTLSYEESPFWPTRSQFVFRTAEINAAPGSCP